MKRYVTIADVFAILLPALAAVVGTWHLVYNHNDNPLGRTATEIGLLYAMYFGGYLFWGAVARATGATSVIAITATMLILGYVSWIALVIPEVAVPNVGGLLAAIAWASRRRDAEWSVPPPLRARANAGDAVAVVLPTILMASLIIAHLNSPGAPVRALRPWAVSAEYIGYLGGYGFLRLQGRSVARRVLMPSGVVAILSVLLAVTASTLGVILLLVLIGMPAAGAAAAGLLAELTEDDDTPAPVR